MQFAFKIVLSNRKGHLIMADLILLPLGIAHSLIAGATEYFDISRACSSIIDVVLSPKCTQSNSLAF